MKLVCQNKKAFYDYFIEDTFEAGIALLGTEVKSLREGKANLKDSYVLIKDSEALLFNCHISPYSHGNIMNHDPLRTRKLLLHKKEIEDLKSAVEEKGKTVVPLSVYLKKGRIKIQIAVAKGKNVGDKRQASKDKDAKREIDKVMKRSSRDRD